MHELALCENVVRAALTEYENIHPVPKRLVRVHVVVGGLHQIIPDFFTEAYELLTRETPVEGSSMSLTVAPVVGRCRDCGWQGEINLPFFECGGCNGRSIETINGMEIVLERLEVEQ